MTTKFIYMVAAAMLSFSFSVMAGMPIEDNPDPEKEISKSVDKSAKTFAVEDRGLIAIPSKTSTDVYKDLDKAQPPNHMDPEDVGKWIEKKGRMDSAEESYKELSGHLDPTEVGKWAEEYKEIQDKKPK